MCFMQISCLDMISRPVKSLLGSGSPLRGMEKKELVKKLQYRVGIGYKVMWLLEHLQHGGFPRTSWSKNKISTALQGVTDDDVFDKLRFVNEIGTQGPSQPGEEARTHSFQDTGAVVHADGWVMRWKHVTMTSWNRKCKVRCRVFILKGEVILYSLLHTIELLVPPYRVWISADLQAA